MFEQEEVPVGVGFALRGGTVVRAGAEEAAAGAVGGVPACEPVPVVGLAVDGAGGGEVKVDFVAVVD